MRLFLLILFIHISVVNIQIRFKMSCPVFPTKQSTPLLLTNKPFKCLLQNIKAKAYVGNHNSQL